MNLASFLTIETLVVAVSFLILLKLKKINIIKKFISDHVEKIKPLFKETQLAYWKAMTSGKKYYYDKYEKLKFEIEKIYNNKEEFEKVKRWLNSFSPSLLKRQLEILYNSYLASQGDLNLIKKITKKSAKIEKKFNTFRAKINKKKVTDNEIKEILKKETNSEKLKQAWEASKKQGQAVEKELIELVKLRNKLARQIGFRNYYAFSLEINEQKIKEITKIFKQLERLTDKPFKKLKKEIDSFLSEKYQIPKEELRPWHYQDLFFQEGPAIHKVNLDKYYKKDPSRIARKFYSSINLPVEDILERSDLYEKKGKCQHAFCIDIDKEGDVRILENIKNNEKWMETTLHELGHASYDKLIDKQLPFILRWPAHTFTTEGIAMLFGRLSKNVSFIKKHSRIKQEVGEIARNLKKALRLRQLVFSRWSQVMFHFERNLYENPNQDLNKLWWRLVKKFQLINFSREKPDWASKIHFVSSPVYYHNYLLGELFASQIHAYIIKNINYKDKKEIGAYLKKIFSPGRRYHWKEFMLKATGKPLTPKYFVEQFVK